MIYGKKYFERDIPENWYHALGLLRPDQLAAIAYAFGLPFYGDEGLDRRTPSVIYSIGCGRGDLEVELERLGCEVIGVDPTAGAKATYRGNKLTDTYEGGGDTVIFCESIEHLERDDIHRILSAVPIGARVIIVNWLSHHPLYTNGYDHVTEINDQFFDELSNGWNVLVRRKSHLVMEKTL